MKKTYLTLASALFFISTYSQSGTCAGATELTNDGEFSSTSGDTTGKGDDGGNSSPDAFYFITPGAFQTVNVGLCGTDPNFDTKITIFSDCTLATIIADNDDSCGLQSQVSFQSDDSSTYIVMVEGSDTPFAGTTDLGLFKISVWFTAPVAQPDAAMGVSCTAGVSGPTILDPFYELDDNSGGWTGDIAYSGNTNGSWEIIASGGAASQNTGPDAAQSGTTYMNYEASGNATATASAVSPAIDLSGLNIVEAAELTFYMHAYGAQMGTLNVGVGASPSGPFTTEMTWSGQYQSASTDPWYKVGVDLSAYIGQVIYVEFENTGAGGGFHGDMSIDLVEISVCDTVLEVEEEEIFEKITLYPNPANDIINIKSQEIVDEITIYNLLGQEVVRVIPNAIQSQIDIAALEVGVYIVKVKTGSKIGSYKIVKQ